MYRNLGGRFSEAPQANIKRSIFGFKHTHKTTFNAGDLVPIFVQEVLPGDTFDINLSSLVRLSTPLHPTMDNLFLDTYFFFVPNRLIWDNWTKFMGENDQAWAQDTDNFYPPLFQYGNGGQFDSNAAMSILNYLGIPVFSPFERKFTEATCLDFNAYIKIFNDWFKDQNLQDDCPFFKGDGAVPSSYITAYQNYLINNFGASASIKLYQAGTCLKAARYHDYFSSALPSPQKGPDVLIPAGGEVIFSDVLSSHPKFIDMDAPSATVSGKIQQNPSGTPSIYSDADTTARLAYDPDGTLLLNGLEITVNNLRLAIQTQKLLEADARGGTRYIELIYSHFGVKSPDARLQRSEYLGGKRTLLNMDEVVNTTYGNNAASLGVLGGRSVTATNESGFVKSFTEHGLIIGIAVVRHSRTYSQGFHRRYHRFTRLQYYWPVLANIGEQPILNKELYLPKTSESVSPDGVFGYQEAWAEYRYTPDRLSGLFSPDAGSGSLISWTYADGYSSTPSLSSKWLAQGSGEVGRTMAILNQPQFIADFYFHGKAVRPMPVFSVPGLIDHH